mgnify:CR=1 FL=1
MNQQVIHSVAASKIQVLVRLLQKRDLKNSNNISFITQQIEECLHIVLGNKVCIIPKKMETFFQVYRLYDTFYICYPIMFLEDSIKNLSELLKSLCISMVLLCCPESFTDMINPHEYDIEVFHDKYPDLFSLIPELLEVLPSSY